jgi:hypothetical protein
MAAYRAVTEQATENLDCWSTAARGFAEADACDWWLLADGT